MPTFRAGESKNAIAPMSNPTAKPFDYSAELYMGTNLVLMTSTNFHLGAGESKDISLPIIMPSGEGSYPVYIGIFSEGKSIALYKAVDDVIITAEAGTYICPYCGTTLTTLSGFFTHIRETHFPIPEDYYYCPYCGDEFGVLDGLLSHFEEEHLDIITAPAPTVDVYLPGQVKMGEEFPVTYTFSLTQQGSGDVYTVGMEATLWHTDYNLPGGEYVDPVMLADYPICFRDSSLPLDHTGQYTLVGTGVFNKRGTFNIWAVAKYQSVRILFYDPPNCGVEPIVEYTIWYFNTGKKVTVT